MGSKNLKAVVVRGSKSITVAKNEEFIAACFDSRKTMKAHPVTGAGLPTYGTQILVNILNQSGALPTYNWVESEYDKADDISGESLTAKYLVRNRGCFGCSIGCGRVTKIPNAKYTNFGEGPEYEAGWSFGADCGVNDLARVCEANFLCNELGMDPITMGATLACAMELYKKGSITDKETGMPLEDLYTLMIILSDNTATNLLIKRLGMESINKTMQSLGLRQTKINRLLFDAEQSAKGIENTISTGEIALLLDKMYRGELISPKASEEMLTILKKQRLNGKIPFFVPKNIEIAHKTGEDSGITHDVAVVYAPRPFIVCFCGNEVNVPEYERVMQEVTATLLTM
jgi:hypothetical protein